eukprot:11059959-Lingulodinium_polyedra.AAC.1
MRDWNDNPIPQARGGDLAGGYRGVLWGFLGDLDHMTKAYRLPHYGSKSPCICCRANTADADTPWTDGRKDAAWTNTVWTAEAWQAAFPNRHMVFHRIPGLSILNYVPDVMHTFHLGIYQWAFGSIIKYIVQYHLQGTVDDNLKVLMARIQVGYGEAEVPPSSRFTNITRTMYE